MFALPNPYIAERSQYVKLPDGTYKEEWSACRVIGVTKNEDGEPVYVVEVSHLGTTSLEFETEIRKRERGDPL